MSTIKPWQELVAEQRRLNPTRPYQPQAGLFEYKGLDALVEEVESYTWVGIQWLGGDLWGRRGWQEIAVFVRIDGQSWPNRRYIYLPVDLVEHLLPYIPMVDDGYTLRYPSADDLVPIFSGRVVLLSSQGIHPLLPGWVWTGRVIWPYYEYQHVSGDIAPPDTLQWSRLRPTNLLDPLGPPRVEQMTRTLPNLVGELPTRLEEPWIGTYTGWSTINYGEEMTLYQYRAQTQELFLLDSPPLLDSILYKQQWLDDSVRLSHIIIQGVTIQQTVTTTLRLW